MEKWGLALVGILICGFAFATDVVIKDVPEGAEERVKEMAAIAIERHLRSQREANVPGMGNAYIFVDQAEVDAYKKSIDDMRVANGLKKKFAVEK